MTDHTYKPVQDAIATLREIYQFEDGKCIGIAYRLRERLERERQRIHPRLDVDYIRTAMHIWAGTA